MRKIIRKISTTLAGDKYKFNPEARLLNFILLLTFLIAFIGIIVNLFLKLDNNLILIIGLNIVTFAFLYYIARFRNQFQIARLLTSTVSFVFLNLLWIFNNGSQGPILYLFIVFYSLLIFVWEGKTRYFVVSFFFLNTALQFYIEMNYPEVFPQYENRQIQLIDIYVSLIMFMGVAMFIMAYAKSAYIQERNNAQKSDKLKSAFLANMSHEIRTPMNAILGFSNLILRDISEEKRKRYKEIINNNGTFLMQLIEDIIDISKIEADYIEINESYFSVNELFNEIYFIIVHHLFKLKKSHIELKFIKPENPVQIFSDRMRIRQIIINLLTNASKFTDEGKIEFGYKCVKNKIIFYIKDTGIGISKEQQKIIFDRFVKIENENSFKYRGTGLGLPICKYLIEKLGGEIRVDSIPDKGSIFTILLPVKTIPDKIEKKGISDNESFTSITGLSVLVVDDEEDNFLLIKEILSEKMIHTTYAVNGDIALELLKTNTFDLILLDIKMPGKDGYHILRDIREYNKSIPVIAQTAYAMHGDKKKILDAGFSDYISKPINEFELEKKIHEIINSKLENAK